MGTRRAAYEGVARAARPTFAGGRWHKARMSAKNVARHRKAAVAAGEEWGGERAGSPLHINPLAGRRRMMQRPDRCARSRPTLPQSRPSYDPHRCRLLVAARRRFRRSWTGCQKSSRSTARCAAKHRRGWVTTQPSAPLQR